MAASWKLHDIQARLEGMFSEYFEFQAVWDPCLLQHMRGADEQHPDCHQYGRENQVGRGEEAALGSAMA